MGHASPISPVPPLLREYQSSSSTANLDVQQPLSPRRVATPPSSGDDDEDRTSTIPTIDSQPGNNMPRESNTMGPITSPQTSLPTIVESSSSPRRLSSPASPPVHLVVPCRARTIGGRSLFESSAYLSRRVPPRPDERHRARTITGHELVQTRLLGFASVLSETLQNALIGAEKTIRDFTALNRNTQTVAGKWSAHVGKIKTLPSSSQPLTRDSPVGKGPSQFPSAEDYAYFSLLSIINTHLYNRIFRPFHPAASDAENAKLETRYQRQVETGVFISRHRWS